MDEHHGFETNGQGPGENREGPKEEHQTIPWRGVGSKLPEAGHCEVNEDPSVQQGEHDENNGEVGHLNRDLS